MSKSKWNRHKYITIYHKHHIIYGSAMIHWKSVCFACRRFHIQLWASPMKRSYRLYERSLSEALEDCCPSEYAKVNLTKQQTNSAVHCILGNLKTCFWDPFLRGAVSHFPNSSCTERPKSTADKWFFHSS